METLNLAEITKKIYDADLKLFSSKTLHDIFHVKNERTFFDLIHKLVEKKILTRIERDRYMLADGKISTFALANFLYEPSYVSFETALNHYGILSQFPLSITSATTKKTVKKNFNAQTFSFHHLQKNLFWGYEKKDGILIASPEKAICDQMHLAAAGIKKVHFDEYDLSRIDKQKLNKYKKLYDFI